MYILKPQYILYWKEISVTRLRRRRNTPRIINKDGNMAAEIIINFIAKLYDV